MTIGEDINHPEEVKHREWWTARQCGDGKRVLQAAFPRSITTACTSTKNTSVAQPATLGIVVNHTRPVHPLEGSPSSVEEPVDGFQETVKKRGKRPSRRVRQRLRQRLARTKDKVVEEELQRIETLTQRKFGGNTLKLLNGAVPENLSLNVGNLLSKTHTDGCNADRYVGGGLSKKRKEIRPRFSKS